MANLIKLVTKYAALMLWVTRITILSLLSLNPVLAYGSDNTIYVKREQGSKPSLLDRKFVFRQVASSPTPQTTSTNLSAMHEQITSKTIPQKARTINRAHSTQEPVHKTQQVTKDPGSNNWNDFAVETELDESREVSAKLLSR